MYSAANEVDATSSSTSAHSCHRFSLAEIQSATRDFDDELVIGKGGFGRVFKGCISTKETSDHVVAIKRLDSMSNQGAPEFRAEIEMLSKLRHCHLVSLIGYCDDNKEMILVYEYMPHGTIYDHLHKFESPLSWVQRLKIAVGAARGLDYLHTGVGTQHGVIHRDVKSSNILLDEKWAAMISDFGLSKISPINQSSSYVDTSVKGTFGYLDPEYFYTRKLTRKTDVYAFGVVLFELLSGRLPVDERMGEEECSLVRWAQKCVNERKLDQMVDSSMRGTITPKCLKRFTQIAYRCLLSVPSKRPTMTEVVASLQASLELQEKSVGSAGSSGITRFPWNFYKYLVSVTKQNLDQSGTSAPKSNENNMKQCSSTDEDDSNHGEVPHRCWEVVTGNLKMFTYDELRRATSGFGDLSCLAKGRYVEVYKGWIDKNTYIPSKHTSQTGLPIAIKTFCDYKSDGLEKLQLDLKMLKEFSHPNLVKLLGYCFEQQQLFLVYEFLQNGNFVDHLNSGAMAQLPLVTKVKIVIGIARGIIFLKKTQDQDEFKRDIWTGSVSESFLQRHKILLDKDFNAKLSDYDVTKLLHGCYARVDDDNFGYYYPGFQPFQLRTNQSGFGVVFAEVLTGTPIINDVQFMKINRLMTKYGKNSLHHIASLCFDICNEVDSESKMLTILEEYDQLIRSRLKSWLFDQRFIRGI